MQSRCRGAAFLGAHSLLHSASLQPGLLLAGVSEGLGRWKKEWQQPLGECRDPLAQHHPPLRGFGFPQPRLQAGGNLGTPR